MMSDDNSSSSDSTSESGEESSPPADPAKVPARHPAKDRKRKKVADASKSGKRRKRGKGKDIELLTQQVSDLQNFIYFSQMYQNGWMPSESHSLHPEISNEPLSQEEVSDTHAEIPATVSQKVVPSTQSAHISTKTNDTEKISEKEGGFKFLLSTDLKVPKIPPTSSAHLDLVQSLQHFKTDNWRSVRYYDTQKLYNSQPGFTDLEANDEIKPFDKASNLASSEKFLAALSHAMIMQSEALQNSFERLVECFNENEAVDVNLLVSKINEIFEGSYQKISRDCLQLVCGRRADLIEQRRELILSNVRDSFQKTSLKKIPPSNEHLFDKEPFSDFVKNSGGINKVLTAPKASSTHEKRLPSGAQATPVPGPSGQQWTARSWAPSMNYKFMPRFYDPTFNNNAYGNGHSFRPSFRPRGPGPQQFIQKKPGPRFSGTGQNSRSKSNSKPRKF